MKKPRKFIVISSAMMIITATLGISGSRADAFLKLPGPLQGLWDSAFGIVEQYAGFAIEQSVMKGLKNLSGSLNLPDPGELFDWVDEVADGEKEAGDVELGDGLTSGDVQGVQAARLKKVEAVSEYAKAASKSGLSKEGQDAATKVNESVKGNAESISKCAKEGADLYVTQDLLKKIMCQNEAQGQLGATRTAQNEQLKRQNDMKLMMDAQNLELERGKATQDAEEKNSNATATIGGAAHQSGILGDL